MFQLCKLSQLCYHFLLHFENENSFFDEPSNPPPIAIWKSLTNQFFQENWRFCILKKKKKKKTEEKRRVPGPFSSLQFCTSFFLKIYRIVNFFLKNWLVNEFRTTMGGGLLGIWKNKYFNFQNATKNVNKVGTIYNVGTFQLFKLSKLCYHFLSGFENGNNFFWYP